MKFDQCRPLITGSSRGIGRAFVDAFLEAGVPKIYAGVRNEDAAAAAAAIDPRVHPLVVDTTRPEQVEQAAREASDVTVLVNNAGVLHYASFLNAPDLGQARHEMEVNYFGPLAMARAFAPALTRSKGTIVNILSIAALAYMPLVGTYNASKAAARSMTQGLRVDLAEAGVAVMAVYAGGYDTEMHLETTDKALLNPPSVLTEAVLEALISGGVDELFPDAAARGLAQRLGLIAAA
ncbi:MAG TPA: SDR family NAD(P)-dependent oxidoreductase [Sphingopyxis sp.]|uniref:SDR family NAD(P)-dependent oxidoreductase n=1 Tax=Sphingopyxis sp. TaxID=1908224 RepID=UPI002E3571F6|nr:SDR family NAD(P)-dependent oxidoreductase [Sphingopyxis sp.]HEX2813841.1 SDR family NAD(P)-dependent oxidoreductase [Sphingopyxis sp.]